MDLKRMLAGGDPIGFLFRSPECHYPQKVKGSSRAMEGGYHEI